MSRHDQIVEFITPYFEAQFAQSCNMLEKKMQESGAEFALRCLQPFMKLLNAAHETQKSAYLCISGIKSGVLTGNYQLRLDLYDESYLLDENPITQYWDIGFLFDGFDRDIEALTEQLQTEFVSLRDSEMRLVRLRYCAYYFALARKLCAEFAGVIGEMLAAFEFDASCQILFGDYLGEMARIGPDGA